MNKVFRILFISFLIYLPSTLLSKSFQNDTIYFKANYDYPPYQLIDEHNNPSGFSVEILDAIAKTMGLNVKLELDTWSQVRLDLENKKIDGVVAMSFSTERSKTVNFSASFIYITHSIFTRKDSDLKSVDDIKNKQVIVVKGDIMHDYLIANNFTKYIIPVKNYQTALRLLSAGEYDCALINKLHGQYAIKEFNLSNLTPVGGSMQPKEICFAIIKGREDVLAQINDGLQIIKSTGEYDQIYDKWFGIYEKTELRTQLFRIISWILIPFLVLLITILFWSWTLRKQVALKTSELLNELNERKKAEKQLLQEKSLLSSMVNAIPDLIFYKNKDNTYIGCNDAFCKFNNMKSTDIIGKNDFDIFPLEDARKYFESDQKLIDDKQSFRQESWETSVSGEKYLLDTLKVPFTDENGNPLGIVGICHDITERYKTEIDLKNAKEKAEESDRLKSSFLANMSHEIRTPMNAIIGFSDLLVDPDTETDEREELVTHINNNCNTLLHLIDDIIDLAKIEADELTVFIKDTDINTVLQEAHETFNEAKKKLDKKHIEIVLDNDQFKDNFHLKTDPYRLRQILTNITDNALKYSEVGTINIGYKILSDIKLVEFYIKDTGIGIPKDKQDEIFQRFNKIETNKSKLYRGTGLGLTITQNLVERLGGTIRVESEVDKGSTFYFTLPLDISESIDEKNIKKFIIQNHKSWKDKTILIAEDEESNYKFLEMLLSNKGIKLLRAENGFEAIELCKGNNNIDLVLMDIKMPGMNGLEATSKIKKFRPDLPIIVQTAYAMQNDEKESMEAGCDDYIAKPIKKEKLISLLEKWIDHKDLGKT
ncbi:transporter substrate-binding domain-containing protein [Bacteroidota bacterium]